MAIFKAYKTGGWAAVQGILEFPTTREQVRSIARRMGVKSDFKGGRPRLEEPTCPIARAMRAWNDPSLCEPGALSWML